MKKDHELLAEVQHLQELNQFKSEFLTTISHQLKAPLASIKWAAEFLISQKQSEKVAKEHLLSIHRSAEQMIALVDNLSKAAKLESGTFPINRQEVDLRKLIEENVSILKPKAEVKSQKVLLDFSEDVMIVSVDSTLFREAFSNILDNAITYAPESSAISVLVKKEKKDYVISVSNQGPAIPEEEQKKIFIKFYRGESVLEAKPGGSGLGLFVAKAAIEALGGKIWFKSPVQDLGGVSFFLSLPA